MRHEDIMPFLDPRTVQRGDIGRSLKTHPLNPVWSEEGETSPFGILFWATTRPSGPRTVA